MYKHVFLIIHLLLDNSVEVQGKNFNLVQIGLKLDSLIVPYIAYPKSMKAGVVAWDDLFD